MLLIKERAIITVGVTADSAVTPHSLTLTPHSALNAECMYSLICMYSLSTVRARNIKDHSHSEQHAHAMVSLKNQAQTQGLLAITNAPIAKELLRDH